MRSINKLNARNEALCSDEFTCCNDSIGTATPDKNIGKQQRNKQEAVAKKYLRFYESLTQCKQNNVVFRKKVWLRMQQYHVNSNELLPCILNRLQLFIYRYRCS